MKETEQGKRETETQRGHEKEREGETVKREVRYFTSISGADQGYVFNTQMCTMLRYWSHSLLVILSGHHDQEPTASRLPIRSGAEALQVEQGPSRGEASPRLISIQKKRNEINNTGNPSAKKKNRKMRHIFRN